MKHLLTQRETRLVSAAASAVAVVTASAACLPQVAFAAENVQVVEGVMTITLQQTPAVATTPTATTTAAGPAATTTAAAASSSPVTGDPVLWLIAGMIALLVAAVFAFVRVRAAQMALWAGPSAAHGKYAAGDGNVFSARGAVAATIAALLVACLCFGMYYAKSTAFAEGLLSGITATSSVAVDESGSVVSSDIAIENASDEDVVFTGITAPGELSDWNADLETDQVIKAAEQATGEWDGKTIPAAVLSKLKENGDTLELKFEVSATGTNLDFEEISVSSTDTTYDGTQFEPAVTSDEYVKDVDYKVTYGENTNAGTGVVTVTGIGNYTGQKTYEFEIAPATLTVTTPSAQKQYDGTALTSAGTIEGFVNSETAEFATTGSQTGVGSSSNSYAISWNGTAKQANYTVSETIGTLEVTANTAKIDVTAGSAEKTYDGSALASSEVTVTGLSEGFTCSATTVGSQTDAGASTNTVAEFAIFDSNGKNVTEYFANIEKHAGALKVSKRAVALASSDATKVYDGSALTNEEVKVAEGGFAGKESFNASVTGAITNVGSVKNAFTYELTNGAKAENYEVKTIEGELSVTPQSISDKMVGVSAEDTTYTGGQLTPEVYVSGLTKGSDYSVSYGENVNAGEGAGTITFQGVGNYTGALTWHFDIQPREVEFAWSNLTFAYDGQPHVPTAKVTNVVAGDAVAVTVDGARTNAGSYTATATALSSANYTLPAGGAATAEFTIKKANPTPSVTLEDTYTIAVGARLQTTNLPSCTNGTYAWENPAQTYSEGTHQASVTFTPNDQSNYNVVAFTVSVAAKQIGVRTSSDGDATVKDLEGVMYKVKVEACADSNSSINLADAIVLFTDNGVLTVTTPVGADNCDVLVGVSKISDGSAAAGIPITVNKSTNDKIDNGITVATVDANKGLKAGQYRAHHVAKWKETAFGNCDCTTYSVKTGTCLVCSPDSSKTVTEAVSLAKGHVDENGNSTLAAFGEGGVAQVCSQCNHVLFGTYEQDDNTLTSDAIEWIKLEEGTDDNGLKTQKLLSLYALEARSWDVTEKGNDWSQSNCEIRGWLNGYDLVDHDFSDDNFYDKAFSATEKNAIATTNVITNKFKSEEILCKTQDKVFLLSAEEANALLKTQQICLPTEHIANPSSLHYWWTRSPGAVDTSSAYVCSVDVDGFFGADSFGDQASQENYVRPALNLLLGC